MVFTSQNNFYQWILASLNAAKFAAKHLFGVMEMATLCLGEPKIMHCVLGFTVMSSSRDARVQMLHAD